MPVLDQEQSNLLLIDGDPLDAYLIESALKTQQLSYALKTITSGEEAVRLMQRSGVADGDYPRVILLDAHLPRGASRHVLAARQKSELWKAIPLIILTLSDNSMDRERLLSAGANYYFPKAAHLDSFLTIGTVIDYFLQKAPTPAG